MASRIYELDCKVGQFPEKQENKPTKSTLKKIKSFGSLTSICSADVAQHNTCKVNRNITWYKTGRTQYKECNFELLSLCF